MKKIQVAAILLASALGGLTSCSKENSGTPTASVASITSTNNGSAGISSTFKSGAAIASMLENATWKVTSYSGPATNTEFNAYVLNYNENNYLVASSSRHETYDGYWNSAEENSTIDMNFYESTPTLEALTGTWKVSLNGDETITMKKIDGSASIILSKTQNTF